MHRQRIFEISHTKSYIDISNILNELGRFLTEKIALQIKAIEKWVHQI